MLDSGVLKCSLKPNPNTSTTSSHSKQFYLTTTKRPRVTIFTFNFSNNHRHIHHIRIHQVSSTRHQRVRRFFFFEREPTLVQGRRNKTNSCGFVGLRLARAPILLHVASISSRRYIIRDIASLSSSTRARRAEPANDTDPEDRSSSNDTPRNDSTYSAARTPCTESATPPT